jgi:DNA-binding GntR family transcriptional regulator
LINKKSLTEQIYNLLKQKILNKDFKLGEKLNTRQIAEENEISLMPVRDALRQLSNEELVENKPRVGFFVKSFSEPEINDILEVRKMYELYCLKNYFSQIDREKIAELKEKISRSNNRLFTDYDNQLHQTIVDAAGNSYLSERYAELINYYKMLFNYLKDKRSEISRQEHLKLIDAILANNCQIAAKTLFKHLNTVDIKENIDLDSSST